MPAVILDGSKIAAQIRAEVGEEVKQLTAEGLRPGLAVVLVGHNTASEIYVRNKVKACEELGILSEKIAPPESSTTEELLELVDDLNRRDDIDGILVQLPLPAHVDSKKVLLAVSPEKDVDGFHPVNVGNLSTQRPGLVPCTPAGVIEILKRSQIPIVGADFGAAAHALLHRLILTRAGHARLLQFFALAPLEGLFQFVYGGLCRATAASPAITRAQAQVSLNDGKSWQRARVRTAGRGRFRVKFTAPRSAQVSLRITAADVAGNTLTETILRAYRTLT